MMRENTLEEFKRRKLEFLVIISAFIHKAQGQKLKWKTKLPQGNTGRVYIYEWDKETRFWLIVCPIITESMVDFDLKWCPDWFMMVDHNLPLFRRFDFTLTMINRSFAGRYFLEICSPKPDKVESQRIWIALCWKQRLQEPL